MLVAGGAALAAYAIRRSTAPADAPRDGGYTAVGQAPKSLSPVADTARKLIGVPMPCGVKRVAYADLSPGDSFAAAWASEARSLAAKFGALTLFGLSTGRPKLTADCCVAWIDEWLAAWWHARTGEPIRFRVWAGMNFTGEAIVTDRTEVPELTVVERIGEFPRSRLGRAWVELVKVRNLALWASGDETFAHCGRVSDGLKEFALALDAAAGAELSGNVLEEAADLARGAAKGAAGAVAWVAAEILGPIAGAVASTVLPFLVVGGVVYLVVQKAT